MDYGKYLYQLNKKLHEAKKHQKNITVKEVKFRHNTDEHDYDFKKNHIIRFLQQGDKVKATVFFRGREIVHQSIGRALLDRLVEAANSPEGDSIQVALIAHDHIYAPFLESIVAVGGRVVICGFREELSPALLGLEGSRCEILDLEHDLGGFTFPLPRPYRPVCKFDDQWPRSPSQIQRSICK